MHFLKAHAKIFSSVIGVFRTHFCSFCKISPSQDPIKRRKLSKAPGLEGDSSWRIKLRIKKVPSVIYMNSWQKFILRALNSILLIHILLSFSFLFLSSLVFKCLIGFVRRMSQNCKHELGNYEMLLTQRINKFFHTAAHKYLRFNRRIKS